jgi:hypothetical protein
MADVRRYSEEEVRAIFERATRAQEESDRPALAPGGGMTLAELQSIGQEVGIPTELVARAATELDRAKPAAIVRRLAGLPIGVGRTVELDHRLTDDEWERLVTELRVTFDARGTVRQEGGLRQWTNGNLQVFVEPSGAGHRLRLRTVKGDALRLIRLGGTFLVGSGILALFLELGGRLGDKAGGPLMLAVAGAVAIAGAAIQLPRWARERARQMDFIATRASDLSTDHS